MLYVVRSLVFLSFLTLSACNPLGSAQLSFLGGSPTITTDPAQSNVFANVSTMVADGSSTVIVTVNLKGSDGNPMVGKGLTLASSRGAVDTITPAILVSDVIGQAHFLVKSSTVGTAIFTASENSSTPVVPITQTASVIFVSGNVSTTLSSISRSVASVVANGSSTSVITVTLRDSTSNPLPGRLVSLSSSRADTITAISATTNGAGVAQFSVSSVDSTTAGGVSTYTATDVATSLSLASTVNVTFTAGGATALAFSVQPSNGIAGINLGTQPRVRVVDANANTVPTATDAITLKGYSDSTCSTEVVNSINASSNPVSASSGISIFSNLKILKSSVVAIGASASGLTPVCSSAISIVAGAPSTVTSTITGTSSIVANGTSTSTITITLLDANANGVPALTPTFTATDTGSTNTYGTCSATNGSGVSTCTLASTKAETKTLSIATPISLSGGNVVFTPGTASQLIISSHPTSTVAGTANSITITAKDAGNNIATGYTGTISFTSSDGQAVLPSNYTFVGGDAGAHTFTTALTLKTAGSQSISVGDGTLSASQAGITVNPAAYSLSQSVVSASSATVNSGSSITATLTTKDAYGNTNPTGLPTLANIVFTSTSVGGTGSFSAKASAGSGVYTATFTGINSGNVTLGATISASPITGSGANVTVGAGTAASIAFDIQPSLSNVAGTAFGTQPRVKVLDAAGNILTSLSSGSVSLSISAGSLVGGTSASIASGLALFSGVQSNLVGAGLTLDASYGGFTATSNTFAITPASASAVAFSTQPASTATAAVNLTTQPAVKVVDAYSNTVTTATDSITLKGYSDSSCSTEVTSSITATTNPLSATAGTSTFAAVKILKSSVVAIGASASGLTPVCSNAITVSAATASAVTSTITGTSSVVANGVATSTITITLLDVNSNPVTSVTPTFSATDTGSTNIYGTCSATDGSGVSTCTLASTKAETKTLTIATPISLSGGNVTFVSGTASQLVISSHPTSTVAGTANSITITARDTNANVATGYTGTIAFTSNDGQAVLPSNYTFVSGDAGTHSFAGGVTLKTAGSKSITVGDGTLSASQTGITVSPAAYSAAQSALSAATATINSSATSVITLTPSDAYGNASPTGLPANAAFSIAGSSTGSGTLSTASPALASGVYTSTLTGVLSGTVTISATLSGTAVGTSVSVTVNPGTAASIAFDIQPSLSNTAGTVFGTQPRVKVLDAAGNILTSLSTGSVSLSISAGSLAGGTSASIASGLATFSGVQSNLVGAGLTLDASYGGFTATSNTFAITPASASALAFQTAPPATATAGTNLTAQPVLKIIDAYSNTVTTATDAITLKGYSDSSCSTEVSSSVTATTNPVSATNGVSTFAGVKILKMSVVAIGASASGLTPVCSNAMSVAAGVASTTTSTITGTSSIVANGSSTSSITITLLDANSNPVTSVTPTFSATDTGSTNIYGTCSATNGSGVSTCTLASTKAETKTLAIATPISMSGGNVIFIAGAASQLVLTGHPTSTVAGTANSITVTAKDANGNVAPTYTGTITFTSNDGQAILPSNYIFVSGDAGSQPFTNGITLKTAGTKSITVSDGTLSVTQSSITVSPAAYSAAQSALSAATSPINSGATSAITLTPSDAYGNASPTGLPANAAFSIAGSSTGSGTLSTASPALASGVYTSTLTGLLSGTVTVSGTLGGTAVGTSANVTVNPGTATQLVITAHPTSTVAGTANSITITAKDANNNIVTGYTGTIAFTSNDGQAVLPSNYTFVSGDNGTHSFAGGVTLKTAGTKSISVGDGTLSASQAGITVTPADYALAQSVVTVSSAIVNSGSTITATLTTKDAYGNTNPTGLPTLANIAFTSTAVGGTGSFSAKASSGSGVYTATFTGLNSGSVTLGATISASPITGGDASVTVNPGTTIASIDYGTAPVNTYTASNSAAMTSFTARIKDAAGNVMTTNSAATITVSVGTGSSTLGGTLTRTVSSGVATFNDITYTKAETLVIRATENTSGSNYAVNSSNITVSAGAYSTAQSAVTASSASVASGSSLTATLTAKDAYGNTNPSGLPVVASIAFTSTTVASGTGSYGSITSVGSGVYTASFTGAVPGTLTLGATISGGAVSNTAAVTVSANPPTVPSSVTAQAGSSNIAISWSASSGGNGSITYIVYRSTTSGSGYASIASGISATNYSDLTALNGTTYYYVVQATNTGGTSANSSEVSGRGIGSFSISSVAVTTAGGAGSLIVTWGSATGAASYDITWGTGGSATGTGSATSVTSPYTVSSLTAGTAYTFNVVAKNSVGSGVSVNASANVAGTPMATFTISSITSGTSNAVVTFGSSTGATSYDLKYGTVSGTYPSSVTGVTSPATVSSLTNGTTYYFVVTAKNASGSLDSAAASVLVYAAPTTSNFTASTFDEDTASSITLSYTNNGYAATTCSVAALTNVTNTTACACTAGVCTVGVTGTSNYNGAGGSFTYTVTANGQTSNSSTASFTVRAVPDLGGTFSFTDVGDATFTKKLSFAAITVDEAVSKVEICLSKDADASGTINGSELCSEQTWLDITTPISASGSSTPASWTSYALTNGVNGASFSALTASCSSTTSYFLSIRVTNSVSNTTTKTTSAWSFWTPACLSNLLMWFDSSFASKTIVSSGKVTDWNDRSGSGYDFTTTSAPMRPTLTTAGQNGKNIITFDGTNNYLQRGSGATCLSSSVVFSGGFSVFVSSQYLSLYDNAPVSNTFGAFFGFGNGVASSNIALTNSWKGTMDYFVYNIGNAAHALSTNYTYDTTTFRTYEFVQPAGTANTTVTSAFYRDGTASGTGTAPVPNAIDRNGCYIGQQSGYGNRFSGTIGEEILINTAVSAGNRALIEGYLAWKWGTTSLLPAGHTYKSTIP